jgi:hypothetical protein
MMVLLAEATGQDSTQVVLWDAIIGAVGAILASAPRWRFQFMVCSATGTARLSCRARGRDAGRDGCRCTASVADRLLQDNAILPKSPEFLDQSIL